MAVKKNVDVNFRVRGAGRVSGEGKKAQKAIDDVGDASKDADEQGEGLQDRWSKMSDTLGGELGPAAGEMLGTFDKITAVFGQVGNAAKVLSGVAILELVTSIGGMIQTLSGSEEALEQQKKAAEDASAAYDALASSIRAAESEAKLAAFRSSIEFQEAVIAAEAGAANARAELSRMDEELRTRRAEQAELSRRAGELRRATGLGGSAEIDAKNARAAAAAARVAEDNAERIKQLTLERMVLQDDLAAAEVARENAVTDAARKEEARLKEIAETLGITEEKRKGAAKATKAQTDALADHVAMLLEFEAASADADALLIEEGAARFAAAFGERVQAAADAGATAIARARQEADALSASLANGVRFAEVFAESMAPLEGIVDGFAAGAAAAAIDVAFFGASAAEEINAVATSVFKQAAILALLETGKGLARLAVGDGAGAEGHFAAAGVMAAAAALAGATAAATGGLGAAQGDAGGGALPQPTRQDFGASNDDQDRRGDTFVIVQGDNYDSDLARDAALGRRAIRGANHLANRPGGPRLAARAIR